MGDFNLDLLESNKPKISEFINLIYSSNCFPCIDRPTRITDHSATLIDNIFTNDVCVDIKSGNLISDITDHFPNFVIIGSVSGSMTSKQECA